MSEEQAGMVPDRAPPEGSGPLPVDDANAADGHVLGDRADLARANRARSVHPLIADLR
jgi:hypothetical protein